MSDVNKQLLDALKRLLECYKMADHSDGYCCCGSQMCRHDDPINCGHSAVDAGEYNASLIIEDVESAIAAAEQAQQVCQYCDGTGDVHSITGDWRGVCGCEAEQVQQHKPKLYPIDRVLMDADHLANAADQLLLAIGKLACAEVDDDSEFHAETVEQCQSEVTDWMRAIVSATHEYRKRANRYHQSVTAIAAVQKDGAK